MLGELAPEHFDEWIAFRRLEPDPDVRLRTIVTQGFKYILAKMGGTEINVEQLDPWYEEEPTNQDDAVNTLRGSYGT